jgi:hypothetical protein
MPRKEYRIIEGLESSTAHLRWSRRRIVDRVITSTFSLREFLAQLVVAFKPTFVNRGIHRAATWTAELFVLTRSNFSCGNRKRAVRTTVCLRRAFAAADVLVTHCTPPIKLSD